MGEHQAQILRFPPAGREHEAAEPGWTELHVHSAFSFLQGASQPDELVAEAARLGISVLAVTDRDGLYAARRLAEAAGPAGIGTVYGAELTLDDPELGTPVVLARTVEGFRLLSATISAAQLAGAKNAPVYDLHALSAAASSGHWAVLPGCPAPDAERRDVTTVAHRLGRLTDIFGAGSVYAELVDHHLPEDSVAGDATVVAARRLGLPIVATGAVHYAAPRQARLAQALAALRRRETLDRAVGHLMPAPTAHLRPYTEMAQRLSRYPGVLETTLELGRSCVIDLGELRPQLPGAPTPAGFTEDSWLRYLAERACAARYGERDDPSPEAAAAWKQLDHELSVIAELGMSGYVLIVHDITQFAVGRGIWCQGRGSAASSVVCYVLGITAVDALKNGLLFERFLSVEKAGPPDIDIDFEAGRREEVIQYVYQRYGRDHAAQVANVISYQPKLSVHDSARVLGYPAAQIREMTRHIHHTPPGPDIDLPADVRDLAAQLHTLPRHMGIHVGGMVLTRQPLGEVMPLEWATAQGRSVLQGDKDDVAAAGLIKIDLLGLGTLGALHTACDLIAEHYGVRLDLASIPPDDPDVYDMIARADTIGVFQVESRAQISTLPQLRPQNFNDLAIAASIIRPGPIQAGSKHPYLRRRRGEEPVTYPHPLARRALEKTLGVALYQEQAMQLAIDCAGFTPGEADRLRKAMAAKHAPEKVAELRGRLKDGMAAKGIPPAAAQQIISMIEAFSDYGFPESHAQSMAHIIYASAWIKHKYPAALTAGIMANMPMGFYDVQTLIQDAQRHGITVRSVDVQASHVHATLEPDGPTGQFAIRRGLTSVSGLSEDTAREIVAARTEQPFAGLEDFARRTHLPARLMEQLATAGAFAAFGDHRRAVVWTAGAFPRTHQPYLPGLGTLAPAPDLPVMSPAEETAADLAATGASATRHPVHHIRPYLEHRGASTAAAVRGLADQTRVRLGGLAKYLQRPPTARGVAFGALEDETGMVNLVFSPPVWERCRRTLLDAPAVLLEGHVERSHGAFNVIVHRSEALAMPVPAVRRRQYGRRGRR
ncbi:error-prone DNA polymerase [Streptomyces cellulosae]|uniref:Error-prone DNA polymerase n=1 Tax=Streptomyces althioticus TaxID=83380 RepID=A0ABZ1YFQ5_9ACTN|nr:error-prone DNA polymerase [Streptomyces cellulosae]WTB93389.1 error-prone DNA polymerase [Streptomyces cellulosae]WTC60781.1 error-prone DNA polymerase [Streptomyces cellulosae]